MFLLWLILTCARWSERGFWCDSANRLLKMWQKKNPNETSCVIKYGGAQASSPHKGWGHHSEEIQKEIENSLVQYDF